MGKKYGKPKKAPTPPSPKPWDVRPAPSKGDPDKDTVFTAVGRALSSWEELESQMAHIFENLVAGEQISLPALRAYGSVLTFRGRGEMINAAADAYFFLTPSDDLKKELACLVEEVGRFAGRRNEIAHGVVKAYYVKPRLFIFARKPSDMFPRHDGYVLGPPDYATNKTKLERGRSLLEIAHKSPSYAYSSVEIADYQNHFERLADTAHKIIGRLWQHQMTQQST